MVEQAAQVFGKRLGICEENNLIIYQLQRSVYYTGGLLLETVIVARGWGNHVTVCKLRYRDLLHSCTTEQQEQIWRDASEDCEGASPFGVLDFGCAGGSILRGACGDARRVFEPLQRRLHPHWPERCKARLPRLRGVVLAAAYPSQAVVCPAHGFACGELFTTEYCDHQKI